MIIIAPIINFYNETKWEIYDGDNGKTVEPSEFPEVFKTIITKTSCNEYIYIVDLTLFRDDFIIAISEAGYTYTNDNVKLKELDNGTAKYLIGGVNATVYDISLKCSGKKIEILDANNFFADRDKVLKTWQKHDSQSTARAYYRAFCDLFEIMGKTKTTPMTISACAKKIFNKMSGLKLMNAHEIKLFDTDLEWYCRQSYHGGFCEAKQFDKLFEDGVILDINSLYPYVMKNYPMPYSLGSYGKGAPKKEDIRLYNKGLLYFFIHIKASFKIKPGHVPCVRASEKNALMHEEGWLTTSDWVNRNTGEVVHETKSGKLVLCELYLTCTDFELFLKSYDVEYIEYIDYVSMATSKQIFSSTIDYLYEIKQNSQGGRRQMSKILMNSISGNMARKNDYTNYYIERIGDNGIDYNMSDFIGNTASYIYIGSAITSYARKIIIDKIGKYYDKWLYSDTDSLHLKGVAPEDINISDLLGDYKIEHKFTKIMYYKHKMYGFLDSDGLIKFKLVGIPKRDTRELENRVNNDLTWYDKSICKTLEPLERLRSVPIDVNYKMGSDFTYTFEEGQMYIENISDYK